MPPIYRRKEITDKIVFDSLRETEDKLNYRLAQKGNGTFASSHEILGIVTEEYFELVDAVKSGTLTQVKEELKDIAVGCLFGIASINAEGVEW